MVYMEGAAQFMRNYRRLVMTRIAWSEAARPRGGEDVKLENPDVEEDAEANTAAVGAKGTATDGPRSSEDNKCCLVWGGMLKDWAFSNLKGKSCPMDRDAKELLCESLKGYWDMAKNWKAEEEELF